MKTAYPALIIALLCVMFYFIGAGVNQRRAAITDPAIVFLLEKMQNQLKSLADRQVTDHQNILYLDMQLSTLQAEWNEAGVTDPLRIAKRAVARKDSAKAGTQKGGK